MPKPPRTLSARARRWPLNAPFRISRGVKTAAEAVAVEISSEGYRGRGEATPYARYGETPASVLQQIAACRPAIEAGADRHALLDHLPPGAARNALDCALFDLEARMAGTTVAELLGEPPLPPVVSALTISLAPPAEMAAAAKALAGVELLKVKVDRDGAEAAVRAVRAAVPAARLIVDPNESWDFATLQRLQPLLVELRVDLVEQPLPAEEDEALAGFAAQVPLCADESCHTAADLPGLRGRFQAVNIKLDKTGGLTEARATLAEARRLGFQVMAGCMVASSLAIAPAFHIARHADFVDLDGPVWLARDFPGGAVQHGSHLRPAAPGVWGGPGDLVEAPDQPPELPLPA